MRSLPLDVGTSPIGRLHRVHVEGAVISGELWITPLLLRICDKLFNLLHHLAHLVLRGLLVLLTLHLSLVTIVLLLVFIADSLFVRHGILVLVLACSLDGNALFLNTYSKIVSDLFDSGSYLDKRANQIEELT